MSRILQIAIGAAIVGLSMWAIPARFGESIQPPNVQPLATELVDMAEAAQLVESATEEPTGASNEPTNDHPSAFPDRTAEHQRECRRL